MRQCIRHKVLAVVLAAGIGITSSGAWAGQKEDNIREILRITESLAIAEQMMAPLLEGFAELFVTLNPESEEFVRELILVELRNSMADNMSDLEELAVIAYSQRFSETEIAELLAFYRTPLGQRLIEETPAIIGDMQVAGGQWGEALALQAYDRLLERLRQEGLDVPA